MTESVQGKSLAEAKKVFERFHDMVTSEERSGASNSDLGKLQVFSGVVRYPARVKCATLAWHTFNAALANNKIETVSTE